MNKILVVDDDQNICDLLTLYLEKEGYTVVCANDGLEALEVYRDENPDLIILDIMLPGMDGKDVCKQIKRKDDVPILMLSAKAETFDKVLCLELGADDYVVKPFEAKELVARVKAIIRRTKGNQSGYSDLKFTDLVISKNTYTVLLKDKQIELPLKEFELLFLMASNPNSVFTRDMLLEKIWGFDFFGDSRTVDVHIKRLREKINLPDVNWQLKTVWGVGYKFEVL
ncbi:MAG TPA: response regulator transcription factor [Clostridia bacterium]|mgnify:FL=1|jgi:two-component system OmpR family response regulator|nr:response regulator transcription factor [Clostridiaceae bacterium]HOF26932.1 response regulator transcription factor [Clostridia bacterium]HOM34586.1 response regulator transcription factor [Clostridia bacterium]HOR89926.1 response regulator transcription factor [Clostridia bacterium]HOT70223.1 response regulator transcription factor [Clostridia bacterium]